jgi:hypothetical protein
MNKINKVEKPFNNLSFAKLERLAFLSEELGEAQQAIGKILRHGYESRHPKSPTTETNRRDIEREIGHVSFAVKFMIGNSDLNKENILASQDKKEKAVRKYFHHQKELPE